MRFFTPDLYRRFNSPDEAEADRADADWELAIQNYRDHLDEFRDGLPSQTRELARLNLHDAELIACEPKLIPDEFWPGVAILSVRQGGKVVDLIYHLWAVVRELPPPAEWPFFEERKHWLYEELDIAPGPRTFLHRVLWSDGSVLVIPFTSVLIHRFALPRKPEASAAVHGS